LKNREHDPTQNEGTKALPEREVVPKDELLLREELPEAEPSSPPEEGFGVLLNFL
jgi:hypothetical protein